MNILSKPLVAALALSVCHAGFASLIVGETVSVKGKVNLDGALEWLDSKKASKKKDQNKAKYFKPDLDRAIKSIGYGTSVTDNSFVRVKKIKKSGGRTGGSKGDGGSKVYPLDYDCLKQKKCNSVSVPEPGTVVLLGIGMLGLAMSRRQYSK